MEVPRAPSRAHAPCPKRTYRRPHAGAAAAAVVADAGALPAVESLFRRVPAASPAHASAAALLAAVLPPYAAHLRAAAGAERAGADADAAAAAGTGPAAVASVLVTLRKFLQRCCGLPDPDIDVAGFVGTQACSLLRRLLAVDAEGGAAPAGGRGASDAGAALATFAASQLLPGTQVGAGCPLTTSVHARSPP